MPATKFSNVMHYSAYSESILHKTVPIISSTFCQSPFKKNSVQPSQFNRSKRIRNEIDIQKRSTTDAVFAIFLHSLCLIFAHSVGHMKNVKQNRVWNFPCSNSIVCKCLRASMCTSNDELCVATFESKISIHTHYKHLFKYVFVQNFLESLLCFFVCRFLCVQQTQ